MPIHVRLTTHWLILAAFLLIPAARSSAAELTSLRKPYLAPDPAGHTAAVRAALFTTDGKRVLTCSRDRTIRVWDINTGETLRTLRFPVGDGFEGAVQAMALSPDGRLLAAAPFPLKGTRVGPVFIIDMKSGRMAATLRKHQNAVSALCFSADGRFLVTAGADRVACIWDTKSLRPLAAVQTPGDMATSLAFSPDGLGFAAACDEGSAMLYPSDGSEPTPLRDGDHKAHHIAWSPDGKTIAVGNRDGTISLWEAKGKLRRTIAAVCQDVYCVAFAPNSQSILVTGAASGRTPEERNPVMILDTATDRELVRFEAHTNSPLHGSFSADGKLVVTTGGNDCETYVWRAVDCSVVQTLRGTARSSWAVGWSPDGRSVGWGHVNAGDDPNSKPLQRTFNLEELRYAPPPTEDFRRAILTREGRSLELSPNLELVVKKDGRPVFTFCQKDASPADRVYCFTWLPDGNLMVGQAFGLFLVNPDTGQVIRRFEDARVEVLAMALSPDGKRVATVSGDMTLRVWHPDRAQAVLSLFTAGPDWIAWAADGAYAASAGGERLMGWQVNTNAEIGLGTWYPAAQFRKSLYQPEVIKRVVRTGDPAAARVAAGIAAGPENVSRLLPPTVEIIAPIGIGTIKVAGPIVEIKASAHSAKEHPVTSLRLLVNGRPYKGEGGIRSVKDANGGRPFVTWKAELSPGTYTLSVVAESAVSSAVSLPVEIQVGHDAADPRPSLYVLAVGINEYPGPMRLQFAVADAEAIASTFKNQAGRAFRNVEVKLITDKQATKKGIEGGLDWLTGKMTHQDIGVVFFSGHGAKEPGQPVYLVTADVDPKNVAGSCLSGDALKARLAEVPGRVIAMLDACHSGAATGPEERPVPTDDLIRDLISLDYGVVVMSSSMGWEYSLESPAIKQGVFTRAVTEALIGLADDNDDGIVYLNEVDAYTARRVRVLSGGRQHPVMAKPLNVRSFPLSRP